MNSVVTGVKDIKDVLTIIYKIATDKTGSLAKKGETILKQSIQSTLTAFNQKIQVILTQFGEKINGLKENVTNISNHVISLIKKLEGYEGLAGILALLAFSTLLQWVNQKVLGVAVDFVKNKGLELLKKAFNSFGEFFKQIFAQLDINEIIGYFTSFDKYLGPIANGAEIIGIMAVILRPVIQRFNLAKI